MCPVQELQNVSSSRNVATMYTNVKKISLITTQNQQGKQAFSVSTEQQLLRGKIFSEDHHHIGGQPALSSSCSSELQDFVGARFYCPHALTDGNQRIWIREKTLRIRWSSPRQSYLSSTPSLYLRRTAVKLLNIFQDTK